MSTQEQKEKIAVYQKKFVKKKGKLGYVKLVKYVPAKYVDEIKIAIERVDAKYKKELLNLLADEVIKKEDLPLWEMINCLTCQVI